MLILVAMDRSERDNMLLPHCVRLAKENGARLALAHVVSLAHSLIPNALREAEAYLTAVQAGLQERGVEADVIARKGDPADSITRIANETGADMIVMATRGRRGWDRMMLGSVAEAVLAVSTRPVILVNESTNRAETDERVRLQSYYLAGVLWNKRLKGDFTETQTGWHLERLANGGLDRGTLYGTYRALEKEGAPSEWLDMRFQVDTLRQFMPDELAGLTISIEPQAA